MRRRPTKKPERTRDRVRWSDRWFVLGVCVFLALITWVVFGQTLSHEFINYDDTEYVMKNAQVSRGLTFEGIAWAFTHVHSANWHPLTWISHMMDCQLYGLNPWGHHLTSVVLHGVTAILLFLLLRQMTGALWRSAFVAALFAIHPLRVESVAWVAERKDVLSGLCFMLTALAYLHYTRTPNGRRYVLVVVAFALGLMCKPMLVSLPLVLLLLDYWPLQRLPSFTPGNSEDRQILRRLILEKLPLLGLALASCAITVFAQSDSLQPVTRISFPARLGNAAIAYADYLGQMFWPNDLAVLYPWDAARLQPGPIFLSVLLLAGVSTAVFILRRRRYLMTGWVWYLIMLGPVIGILQVGNQSHADRYTYLPQIGLYLILAWGAVDLCARWRHHRVLLGGVAALAVGALIFSARIQAAYWRDSETLWSHALAATTENIIAEGNLGQALHAQGKDREAMMHFQNSLRINRHQAAILSSVGVFYLEMGRPDESIAHLLEALEIEPNYQDAHFNLGNTYLQIGNAEKALAQFQRALEIDPEDTQAMNNMAWILATCPDDKVRDGAKAVELAERAHSSTGKAKPRIAATLAAAYAEVHRFDDAVRTARRAIELAVAERNNGLADSIRGQLQVYEAGAPFRDRHLSLSR